MTGEKLSFYCNGDCKVDETGKLCVLGTEMKEQHLKFAEGLLSNYETLTRKTLGKLDRFTF